MATAEWVASSCVSATCSESNDVVKPWAFGSCVSVLEVETDKDLGSWDYGGVWGFRWIGGEFKVVAAVATSIDALIHFWGKKVGREVVFLLRVGFFWGRGLSEMVASLVETLVHLFGRKVVLLCLFLFSIAMGRLSSKSSLGIWTIGLDDSTKLWDGVDAVRGSIGLIDFAGGIYGGLGMLSGCFSWGFSRFSVAYWGILAACWGISAACWVIRSLGPSVIKWSKMKVLKTSLNLNDRIELVFPIPAPWTVRKTVTIWESYAKKKNYPITLKFWICSKKFKIEYSVLGSQSKVAMWSLGSQSKFATWQARRPPHELDDISKDMLGAY